MITFNNNQVEINFGNHKILKNKDYRFLYDIHILIKNFENSGYNKKFYRIISIDKNLDINIPELRDVLNNSNVNTIFDFMYFENGGYEYIK